MLAANDISTRKKLAELRKHESIAQEYERYLNDFGDRCLEELKLESPTLWDEPDSFLVAIGALALRAERNEVPSPAPMKEGEAENPVDKMPKAWWRRLVFRYVLRHARSTVQRRENLRFERTRLFGRVRMILRHLGNRLYADGLLTAGDDVFYLELGEILGAWEGIGTSMNLGALAQCRKKEFRKFHQETPPPDRFTTRGLLSRHATFPPSSTASSPTGEGSTTGSLLIGVGACPGIVNGKVRVITDPRNARIEPGEILVAQQTDPGWVILFPAASGLLVERGSLLSHSAIVSRELGLPCVVSLPEITRILKTGDTVEMDGSNGTVEIIDTVATEAESK